MESNAKNWMCCICREKIKKFECYDRGYHLVGHTVCIKVFKELLGRSLERD